jgi:hypothetical protein
LPCRSQQFELHVGQPDQMRRMRFERVCPTCQQKRVFAVVLRPTENAWGTAQEFQLPVQPTMANLVCCRHCRGFRFGLSEAGNEVATKCTGCGHKATLGFLSASQV